MCVCVCVLGVCVTNMKDNLPDNLQLLKVKSILHLLKEPKFPSEFIIEYIRLLER